MASQLAHWSCFSKQYIQRNSWTSLLTISVWPSIWGWKDVDNLVGILRALLISCMTCAANCGPQSEVMECGSPWYLHMLCMNTLAMSRAKHVFVQGINSTFFENWSTTIKIISKPWERGRSVMKLAEICSHGNDGVSSGWRRPTGAMLDPLSLWHVLHLVIYSLMVVAILGQ